MHLDVREMNVERKLLPVLIDVLLNLAGFRVASNSRIVHSRRNLDPRDAVDLFNQSTSK